MIFFSAEELSKVAKERYEKAKVGKVVNLGLP